MSWIEYDENMRSAEEALQMLFDDTKDESWKKFISHFRRGDGNAIVAELQTRYVGCTDEQKELVAHAANQLRLYLPKTKEDLAAQLPDVPEAVEPEYVDENAYRIFYGVGASFLTLEAAKRFVDKEIIVVTGRGVLKGTKKHRVSCLQSLILLSIDEDGRRIEALHDGVKVNYFYVFGGDLVTGSGADPVVYFT